ncbi:MAG TPA: AAA family ATPase [Deltaproteobacteria bacterium]|nr:AAA family ATPase [Deltaproteobacteria bacterium]HPP79836.1 AAA family ATPase [Deltaproteobacteria bacterium]
MYREHFGLKLKPFSITPDPKFLYMSPQHKEALAHLLYGLKEGSGFVVITGEVGTGKTTILNAFLLKLPPRIPKVVIKNPHIKPENLYYLLGEAIGMPEDKRSRDFLGEFEERLKATGGAVLICDEAQGLSFEMLEEIRLLSNLETVHEKLVQIMLLGQQELNDKLNSHQLRQLKQRIGVKYNIPPLDLGETRDYIDHRLRVAGYEPKEDPLFTPSAIGEIYRYTRGFPRLINIVCDNVLLAAYSDDLHQVSASLVKKVVSGIEKTYARHASKVPAHHIRRETAVPRWATVTMSILLAVTLASGIALFLVSPQGRALLDGAVSSILSDDKVKTGAHGSMGGAGRRVTVATPGPGAGIQAPGNETDGSMPAGLEASDAPGYGERTGPGPTPAPQAWRTGGARSVVVGPGDTLAKIAARHYGRVDAGILRLLAQANRDIRDINLVYEGQRIILPPVSSQARELYTVSVAAYRLIDEATPVFLDLVKRGYPATIYAVKDADGKVWYRVSIGTFTSVEEANGYAGRLRAEGFRFAKVMGVQG